MQDEDERDPEQPSNLFSKSKKKKLIYLITYISYLWIDSYAVGRNGPNLFGGIYTIFHENNYPKNQLSINITYINEMPSQRIFLT